MYFDGEFVWVANAHVDTVTKLSLTGEVAGIFQTGDVPLAITGDVENIWVANWREATISKFTREGVESGRYLAGYLPFEIVLPGIGELPFGLTFDGQHIWIANSGFGTLSKMDTDGHILGTYPVGGSPAKLAFDGESIWVTNTSDDTVSKLTLP
jgi:DNA-binding beta-propeller fold protein YncE